MKNYFCKMEELGQETVEALRTHDAGCASMLKELDADLQAGNITHRGYDNHQASMNAKRKEIVDGFRAAASQLQREFEEHVDKICTPSIGWLNAHDAEILRLFELSPQEFEAMAARYSDNPTMSRLLDQYRVQHEGKPYGPCEPGRLLDSGESRPRWHTDWKYQTADERKAIFKSVCNSVESIIGQSDKYVKNRNTKISARISSGYHSIQGADPNVLPAPMIPQEEKPARNYTLF